VWTVQQWMGSCVHGFKELQLADYVVSFS
jgi:hypothetical protein